MIMQIQNQQVQFEISSTQQAILYAILQLRRFKNIKGSQNTK